MGHSCYTPSIMVSAVEGQKQGRAGSISDFRLPQIFPVLRHFRAFHLQFSADFGDSDAHQSDLLTD
jgi:hypothetical protein